VALAGAEYQRPLPTAQCQLRIAAANLGEIEQIDVESPAALEVMDVVMNSKEAPNTRFRIALHVPSLVKGWSWTRE
jgi:hypothetical protein